MSVFVRIFLRYLAGALVARGFLMESDGNLLATDPELASLIEMGLGLALGAVSEGWYAFARKFGWAK
jgi:hypothetical protein